MKDKSRIPVRRPPAGGGKAIKKKRPSLKTVSSSSYSRLGSYDVVFGTSTAAVTTVGNRRFRVTLDLAIEMHQSGKNQGDWGAVIDSVTALIHSVGGRFIGRNDKRFVVLSNEETNLKVGLALRQRAVALSSQVGSSFIVGLSGLLIRTNNPPPNTPESAVSALIVAPATVVTCHVTSLTDLPSFNASNWYESTDAVPSVADISDDELSLDSDPVDWLPPTHIFSSNCQDRDNSTQVNSI